jgi:hypothetical protein
VSDYLICKFCAVLKFTQFDFFNGESCRRKKKNVEFIPLIVRILDYEISIEQVQTRQPREAWLCSRAFPFAIVSAHHFIYKARTRQPTEKGCRYQ